MHCDTNNYEDDLISFEAVGLCELKVIKTNKRLVVVNLSHTTGSAYLKRLLFIFLITFIIFLVVFILTIVTVLGHLCKCLIINFYSQQRLRYNMEVIHYLYPCLGTAFICGNVSGKIAKTVSVMTIFIIVFLISLHISL